MSRNRLGDRGYKHFPLERPTCDGRHRSAVWSLRSAWVCLLGLVLLAAGCHAGKAHDLDGDGDAAQMQSAPTLPPDTLQLSPVQQHQLGLVNATVQSERLPQPFTTTVPIGVPAGKSATVASPVSGYAELWHGELPEPGAHVRAGQPLALVRQFYAAPQQMQMRVALRQAQTQAATLQARLAADLAQQQRSQHLYHDGIAPLRQVQQDEAAVAADRAALADATGRQKEYRAALDNSASSANPSVFVLHAPIAGTVAAVHLTPGQMVDPAQPLFTIVNDEQIWLEVPVPENALGSALKATSAVFSVAAFPGRWFPLARVGSPGVVDAQTHTLPVIYSAPNGEHAFHSGMIATVQLLTPAAQAWPVVPASALVHEGGVTVVFVVSGQDRFRRQPVAVQYISADQAAIAQGLQPGEQVVAQGASLLESELHVGNVQGDD